jgi:hypothetical protein
LWQCDKRAPRNGGSRYFRLGLDIEKIKPASEVCFDSASSLDAGIKTKTDDTPGTNWWDDNDDRFPA